MPKYFHWFWRFWFLFLLINQTSQQLEETLADILSNWIKKISSQTKISKSFLLSDNLKFTLENINWSITYNDYDVEIMSFNSKITYHNYKILIIYDLKISHETKSQLYITSKACSSVIVFDTLKFFKTTDGSITIDSSIEPNEISSNLNQVLDYQLYYRAITSNKSKELNKVLLDIYYQKLYSVISEYPEYFLLKIFRQMISMLEASRNGIDVNIEDEPLIKKIIVSDIKYAMLEKDENTWKLHDLDFHAEFHSGATYKRLYRIPIMIATSYGLFISDLYPRETEIDIGWKDIFHAKYDLCLSLNDF